MAIHARPSSAIDSAGDMAVETAMASDNAMFHQESLVSSKKPDDSLEPTGATIPSPIGSPRRDKKPNSNVLRFHTPEITAAYDPIQPAEDFPPTPVQQNKSTSVGTPSTPRMVQRMKDRNGKIPVRLSQLDPPFALTPQTRATSLHPVQNDIVTEGQVDDGVSQKSKTRSSTRISSIPPPLPPSPQLTKRRRAPNKTAEQRAQEAAAKLVAKEERARIRKEKAETKAAGKKGATNAKDSTPPPSDHMTVAEAQIERPTYSSPHTSRTPMSQDEWTVLKSASPLDEEYQDAGSMRDELRSSSPEPPNHQDGENAPLFLPAESQLPFPYSQWDSVPDDFRPGSPQNSGDEEEEEEVAMSMKSSQSRPGTYRRLTDIASQPSLFSTPPLRPAEFLPSTFPRAKDKREELYGTVPRDDDSTDSDSSAGDAPSHIPKSRRAGMAQV
ncbi:hypothetical protein B0H15DRAFT_864243 [Mycena belliarum]|uniref:Uncharacterized protein n=1 Tax=Mycena belliarum TaxID=1033014 RepID=A0AAD6TUW4_9AGAR|nr:hypothetical protein B0H15DRAFT_864243 [Mycena belliae]